MTPSGEKVLRAHLSGWGNQPVLPVHLHTPSDLSDLTELLDNPQCIPRGEGRSYSDQSINDGGQVIQMRGLNRIIAFDSGTGMLHCDAGVTLNEIQQTFIPQGWMLPVTPGTRHVQVGGAIAADVHGKNHHRAGAFSRWTQELRLLLPDGRELTCNDRENRELFRATAGGMGLTGFITEAKLQLKRISTSRIVQQQQRAKNLSELLELLQQSDRDSEYSVAWLDGMAGSEGDRGRGIVFSGNDAGLQDLSARQRLEPLRLPASIQLKLPWHMPRRTISRFVIQSFNKLYRWSHGNRRSVVDLFPFFYPLDVIDGWNRVYGRTGFTQYQCVLPEATGETGIAEILQRVAQYGGSSLVVLKRMGEGGGLLSFPVQGLTIAMDFPLRSGLFDLLAELDEIVIQHGGRVYLAKNLRLQPDQLRQMYPDLPRWLEIRRECDPEGKLMSGMSKRLEL